MASFHAPDPPLEAARARVLELQRQIGANAGVASGPDQGTGAWHMGQWKPLSLSPYNMS